MSIAGKVLDALHDVQRASEEIRSDIGLPTDGVGEFWSAAVRSLSAPELRRCVPLWITGEMVDLARHASATLPPYAFAPSVLPWPNAFCLAEKPLFVVPELDTGAPATADALIWSDTFWTQGAYLVLSLGRPKGSRKFLPLIGSLMREGDDWSRNDVRPPLDGLSAVPPDESIQEMGRLICTVWLLLQQRVAVKRRVKPDRSSSRRWQRSASYPVPEVTVIELRRPMSLSGEPMESHPREWSHRWMVDGHWRNQYYPSTEIHRPVWIAPYVKGPEDKPLVVKERVYSWTR